MKRMTTALVALCAVVGVAGCSSEDDPDAKFRDMVRTADFYKEASDSEIDEFATSICGLVEAAQGAGESTEDSMSTATTTLVKSGVLSDVEALAVLTGGMGLACPELSEGLGEG